MNTPAALFLALVVASPLPSDEASPFQTTLATARTALEKSELDRARTWIWKALERDPKSLEAWDLRTRWAEAVGDTDEAVYSLHRQFELSLAQGLRGQAVRDLRQRLKAIDPLATELLSMNTLFIDKLLPLAQAYERDKRPHSAIATYREVLALDPEHEEAVAAIERISSLPDPSLAADSSGTDLFEGVSDEWIRKHDEKHAEWSNRAKYKSEYYNVNTNAGYKVMIQAATAMDQMHLFYKRFFDVTGGVARIDLNIFKSHDEYLKKGQGPPAEWSGGQFTGGAVEVPIGRGGFQSALGTLFHEAAHQFVNRATSAGGWLNEGLASFFEGTRLLSNGTVLMNFPAMHRLSPLAQRLRAGWMKDEKDGTDDRDPNVTPSRAPTFGIVLENKYAWGPAWYAPTWGVVYFAYNYQDPVDGRFIYRESFLEFLNKSGGRTGESAVKNFEDVVLANPAPPTPGVESTIATPETVAELNEIWKQWLLDLENEQLGAVEIDRPYLDWGRYAIERGEFLDAAEHFEKGLSDSPNDPELLMSFAELLAEELDNEDRAVKLVLRALRVVEASEEPDERFLKRAEKLLYEWDPERKSLDALHAEIHRTARGLIQRYLSADRNLMTMHLASRLGEQLAIPGVRAFYEEAWRRSGKSLHLWKLAYNETDLEGWSAAGNSPFRPNGVFLESRLGAYSAGNFSFDTLPMEFVTTGDFSLEAEVFANTGQVGFAGLVFGMKGGTNFNALIFLPGKGQSGALAGSGFIDLATFNGGGEPRVWRHIPAVDKAGEKESRSERWTRLRIDVTGSICDVYLNGELKVVHEFPTRDSVTGSLGLIAGSGQARFRNVRYLARPQTDYGAELERAKKMESYGGEDQSIGGSWLGKKPPFPVAAKWLQGERESWSEAGPVPQLLVMWSIRQNDLIPIDAWLKDIADKYSDVGLEVLSVCSVEDTDKAEAYIASRQFPGAVALDGAGAELGDTFDKYAIANFNLPRLILLDIDGKVVWEGDPGFKVGSRGNAGKPSYIDAPLEELVTGRNLRALASWRRDWKAVALPAMHEADLRTALPILARSREFKARGDSDVFDAQARLAAVKDALRALDTTVELIEREKCGPAVRTLLDWAEIVDVKVDKRAKRSAMTLAKGSDAELWEEVLEYLRFQKRREKKLGEEAALEALRTELASREGGFPKLLLSFLEGVDPEAVRERLEIAERVPELWLAREFFRW